MGFCLLWEKSGSRNPALRPLKCAQVTLDLLYNSLILSSQTLELASDQEAPDAGLVWRTRGKKTLITAKMEGIFGNSPEVIPMTAIGDPVTGKG